MSAKALNYNALASHGPVAQMDRAAVSAKIPFPCLLVWTQYLTFGDEQRFSGKTPPFGTFCAMKVQCSAKFLHSCSPRQPSEFSPICFCSRLSTSSARALTSPSAPSLNSRLRIVSRVTIISIAMFLAQRLSSSMLVLARSNFSLSHNQMYGCP